MTETMKLETEAEAMRNVLAWYEEKARLARLNHSEGDPGRWALAEDGGKRAREALALSAAPAPGVKVKPLIEVFERWKDGYAFNEDSDDDVQLLERADYEARILAALSTEADNG